MKELWAHQQTGLDLTVAAIDAGERRICLTSPTGGGKSELMRRLILWADGRNWPTVLYTNRKLLLDQTVNGLKGMWIDHGIRASGHDPALLRNVQVSSIQTEESRVFKRQRWELHSAKLVLVDEAHAQGGPTAEKVLSQHLADGAAIVGFTATPLDIGHIYDRLIVAGTNSELRACGAHVICHTYGPDEPDMRKFKPSTKTGEFTEGDVVKAIMTPTIFARVFDWWNRLNPDARQTILFAPGVSESIWFAEQFVLRGVPAAHIDGDDIWLDGKAYPSTPEGRADIIKGSEDGSIKVICNRFVLREAVDLPWLYHGIGATVFGGLSSFLQSGGRLLRSHPSLDHVCIARDTPILTDRGLVKIQDVTKEDRVWDGIEFVSHDGPTCMGHMEVIEWDGLTATPEHKVHTQHGWTTIAAAARGRERLTRSGVGRDAVRVFDDSDPYNSLAWTDAGSARGLLEVREKIVQKVSQDRKARAAWLRALHEQIWGPLPRMDLSPRSEAVATMQRPEGNHLSPLWWSWNQIQVCFGVRWGLLDYRESWSADESQALARPNRQRWALPAGQSSLGECCSAKSEPRQDRQKEFSLSSILSGIPGRWLRAYVSGLSLPRWSQRAPDCRTVAETWDIVNAGPRHRFTASGVLVGNCWQDHGGSWWRHGSLNADREWRLEMTNTICASQRANAMREKKETEPIVCPECGKVRSSGPECPQCHHRHEKKSRRVVQVDGTLKEMGGDIFKERKIRQQSNTLSTWVKTYHRAKRSGMNFNQAYGLFFHENKYWPPRNLPLMPKEAFDWSRKVSAVPYDNLVPQPAPERQGTFA